MGADGKTMGARYPPSFLAKCCAPPCAISGYETGDTMAGICAGGATIATVLHILTGGLCSAIYALFIWKPDPTKLTGDTEQRTIQNKCAQCCCVGPPCAIAFWESGDMCHNGQGCTLFTGDAMCSMMLSLIGLGQMHMCCCWQPKPQNFKRTDLMHGGGKSAAVAMVGQAVAVVGGAVAGIAGAAQAQAVAAVAK